MSDTIVQKPGILEELTLRMALILGLTFLLLTTLLLYGWSSNCFAMFLIGIGLYMIPKMSGIKNIKLMAIYGVVFTAVVLILGTFVMAPGVVDSNSTPSDSKTTDYEFTNVTTYASGNSIEASAVIKGDIGVHTVYMHVGKVVGLGYTDKQMALVRTDIPMNVVNNLDGSFSVSATSVVEDNQLYVVSMSVTKTVGGEEKFDTNNVSNMVFIKDFCKGNLLSITFYGVLMCTIFSSVLFFIVLTMSAYTRSKLESTRAKMEAEGRLYPQGYGRCDSCGAIVLPGEVNCRKCGAYIDRPESMKPNKADYFTCSECGAEVRSDATECPKCGANFDEDDEIEVVHADGKTDITTKTFNCSECGLEVPETATFCPRCGKKFKDQ